VDYFQRVAALPLAPDTTDAAELADAMNGSGFAVIGTPDDAIAKITELVEASDGGFGAFLLFDHDWASPSAKLHSYELFAQYVIPHFTGQLAGPVASRDWVTGIGKAIHEHVAEQHAKQTPATQ
jgi:limonene 1,2-monooxygenase